MPFGISESALRRAYAPLDLSGVYNRVDAFQKTLVAENKAKKQEALKQYYTDLASIQKEKTGVRAADAADISKLYNEWSNTERQLANNPRLIQRNPEEYGKLKNQSAEKYSQLMTVIQGSKQLAKEETEGYKNLLDPQKQDTFMDGAAGWWKQNVMNNRYVDIVKNGYNDITKLYEPTINGAKFRADLAEGLATKGFRKHEVSYQKGGQTFTRTFEKAPDIEAIQGVITKSLYSNFGEKRADKYAAQELNSMNRKDLDDVVAIYENYRNNVSKQVYGKDAPTPPDLFSNWDEQSNAQRLINIKTAKALANVDTSFKESVGQMGAKERALLSAQLQEQAALRKEARADAKEAPKVDIYSSMIRKMPTQTEKEKKLMFPGTKFISQKELKEFDAPEQSAVISFMKELGFEKPLSADFKITVSPNNEIQVVSNRDVKDGKNNLYSKGEVITTIPKRSLNIKASGVFGVGGRKAAAGGGDEAADFGL